MLLVLLVLVPHYSHLHWPGRRALRQCHGIGHMIGRRILPLKSGATSLDAVDLHPTCDTLT